MTSEAIKSCYLGHCQPALCLQQVGSLACVVCRHCCITVIVGIIRNVTITVTSAAGITQQARLQNPLSIVSSVTFHHPLADFNVHCMALSTSRHERVDPFLHPLLPFISHEALEGMVDTYVQWLQLASQATLYTATQRSLTLFFTLFG